MDEIWKPIAGTRGLYEVSNQGRVRSKDRHVGHRWGGKALKRGKVLRPRQDKDGYLFVTLSAGGKQRSAKVHRLVALHFLPRSKLPEVNHCDMDKANNAHTNLQWTSRKGNQEHASANNVFSAKYNSRRAKKLTFQIALAIRAARESGKTYAEIAKEFGVSGATAFKIVRGDVWS